eukprot:419046_1
MGMGKGEEELGVVLKPGEKSSDLSLRRKRNASEVEHSDQKNEKRSKIVKSLREAGVVGEDDVLAKAPRRLQVLWDVESDGTTESFWWSCELVADGHDVNDQGRVVCTLKYDAHEEFSSEQRKVIFLSHSEDEPACGAAGTLIDLQNDENMSWRVETDDDALKNVLTELGTEVVNLSDVVAVQSHLLPSNAEDDAMMNALKTMPINQQLSFAEGFRTLTDKLKEKLRDLQDSKKASGEDLVVNERDMKDIVGELVLESITTGSSSV